MAQVRGVRIRPTIDPLQETVEGFDPASASGTLVLYGQIVAYDDTQYNPATAVPGRPDDEAWLDVLYEAPLKFDLAALAGKTQDEVLTIIREALIDWATSVNPATQELATVRQISRQLGIIPMSEG